MKLLIADPADVTALEYFKKQGIDFDYQPKISPEELLFQVSSFAGLMVRSRTKVTADVITKGAGLKVVARIGSGYDNIDIEACKKRNIIVINSPDANSRAVAELTVGLTIAFLRELPRSINSMKEGLWIKNEIWGSELAGKIVGIVGFGHVGKRVEQLVLAFGASALIHSRSYQTATLEEIFEKSDIVTLHLPLTAETKDCINRECLNLMKSTAILVNIARGELIDEEALYHVLAEKRIKGAILDVYWQEPLPADSRWRKLDNVILTPHIGAATREALARASLTVAKDIVRVLKGEEPQNKIKY